MLGLRLPEAPAKVKQFCDYCKEVADTYPVDDPLFADMVDSWRLAAGQAQAKLAFLAELPYSLAGCRVDPCTEDSVLKRCLRQFDAQADEHHHRVSVEFCSKNGELRRHMDELAASGTLSPKLDLELASLEHIPLSEERAEGVHRDVSKEVSRAPASKLAHLAASSR